jgi:hypothetical protein
MINVQLLRGTTAEVAAYIGKVGELTVDTDLWLLYVHDGTTPGGHLVGGGNTTGAHSKIFTANGTFTIASPNTKATLVGAGGGGAGTNAGAVPSPPGGGAGAVVIKSMTSLTIGNTLAVTVGTRGSGGGTANAGGGAGTASIVASGTQTIGTLTAGGGAAASGPTGNAGVGGSPSGGDINLVGNGGGSNIGGVSSTYPPFGDGGGVPLNSVVINGHTQVNQEGAQGFVLFEW